MGGKKTALAALKAIAEAEAASAPAYSSTSEVSARNAFLSGNTTAQSAVIFDAISEGPIEGLKSQGASIKLNGDRAYSLGGVNNYGISGSANASYNATTGIVTDHNSPPFMTNAESSHGTRKILIVGGSKSGVATTTRGSKVIISSDLNFASTDVSEPDQIVPHIRIDGAGLDGSDYAGRITSVINTTAVEVNFAPGANVTNQPATIDLVKTISSYDKANNRVYTTPTTAGIAVNNGSVVMSTPYNSADFSPAAKYDNFGWAFRTGNSTAEEGQTYLPTPAGTGSAGIAFQVQSGELKQIDSDHPNLQQLGLRIDGQQPAPTGSPVVVTTSQMGVSDPGEVDLIKLTVNFPQGLIVTKTKDGATDRLQVEHRIKFEYSRDGGSSYTSAVVIGRANPSTNTAHYNWRGATYQYDTAGGHVEARTTQAFNYIYAFDTTQFQPFDDYRVVIERLSLDTGAKKDKWIHTSTSRLVAVENIITDKLTYPYTAYGGVIVGANEFSAIPARAYEIRGLKVKVPTNYFPKDEYIGTTTNRRSAAAYTRNVTTGADTSAYVDWDGNFRGDKKEFSSPTHVNHHPVYTNNPVWIFMDLLTNPRYGLGKYIDPDFDFSQIDKFSLYALAKYCDELVPDGKGGTEPRFTCNTYIQKQDNAIKVLKDFATTMRAMLLWHDGTVGLGANIQKGAVYTFNKTNVVGGVFTYLGSSDRTKANQVKVTWNNPLNNYKQEIAVVEDTDNIAKIGKIKTKSVTAFGCTSEGQAIRYGKWHLLSNKLEREMITFATGINGGMLRPGEVINVADSDREGVVTSGRVTSTSASTTTVIKLDRDLSAYLNQTATYKLHLIYPEGGAYLSQPTATINSTTYYQGDLILLDESGNAVDTETKAINIKDDSGNTVVVYWSEDTRIESKTISSYDETSATVSSAFSSAPSAEVIYTISGEDEQGSDLLGSMKQYMITSIKEQEDYQFSINAAEYDITKFDIVDRGYVLQPEDDFEKPRSDVDVPAPENLVLAIVPDATDTASGESSGITRGVDVLASWTAPKSTRVNEEGDAVDDVYEHLSHYEMKQNISAKTIYANKNRSFTVAGDVTSHLIENAFPKFRAFCALRTVNNNGHKSDWVYRRISIGGRHIMPSANAEDGGLNGGITKGGTLTTAMNINSSNGTVTFASSTYSYQPLAEADPVVVASGNTAFTQQTFPGMSDGDTAYLIFDYDGALDRGTTRSDPLQAVILSEDTTATDSDGNKLNFSYLKRLGQSNEDFVQLTGTVTSNANSPEVIGTSTTFETQFEAGDLIIIGDAGTTRHIATVGQVDANTALTITNASSRAFSGANVFRQAFRVDNDKDCVLARVDRTGSSYTLTPYTNKQPIESSDELGSNVIVASAISTDAVTGIHIQANSIDNAKIAANAIQTAEIQSNTIFAAQIVSGQIDNSHIAANSIGAANIIAGVIDSSHIAANSIGSAAITANSIGSSEITANSIGSVAIAANAITSSEISANSIDTINIAANAITSSEIEANAIGSVAISANAITSSQLSSNAIAEVTVSANSITSVEIASNAIGNTQISANSITNLEISANSVESSEIAANSVNGTILAGNSVSGTQITAGSVQGIIIADNAIIGTKIAQNAVDTAQLITGAVESLQIANNAINNAKIALNSVNTSEIISDAITGDLIAANAVDTAQIKANSITSAAIVAGAIGTSEIAANSIGTTNIIAGTIDSSHISANSIGSTAIVAGAIGTSEISANSIGATAIIAGQIDNSHISANSITAASIETGAIDSSHIAANQITAAAILSNSINNSHIEANTINSVVIDSDAVGQNQIAANAITNAKIKTGAVTNASINASAGIEFAKISVSDGDIDFAKISIANGDIAFAKISVGTGDITNVMIDAVGADKVSGTIENVQIASGAINNTQIQAGSINTAQIQTCAITSALIAANSVQAAEIKSGVITNAMINASASIDFAKISVGSGDITNAMIASNAIDSAEIKANAVTSLTIAVNAVDTLQIASCSITAAKIASISANSITTGTLVADRIAANSIDLAGKSVADSLGIISQTQRGYVSATDRYYNSVPNDRPFLTYWGAYGTGNLYSLYHKTANGQVLDSIGTDLNFEVHPSVGSTVYNFSGITQVIGGSSGNEDFALILTLYETNSTYTQTLDANVITQTFISYTNLDFSGSIHCSMQAAVGPNKYYKLKAFGFISKVETNSSGQRGFSATTLTALKMAKNSGA